MENGERKTFHKYQALAAHYGWPLTLREACLWWWKKRYGGILGKCRCCVQATSAGLSTMFAMRGACGGGAVQDIAVPGRVSAPARTPEMEQNNTILKRSASLSNLGSTLMEGIRDATIAATDFSGPTRRDCLVRVRSSYRTVGYRSDAQRGKCCKIARRATERGHP